MESVREDRPASVVAVSKLLYIHPKTVYAEKAHKFKYPVPFRFISLIVRTGNTAVVKYKSAIAFQ